jgi:hypothetical protein
MHHHVSVFICMHMRTFVDISLWKTTFINNTILMFPYLRCCLQTKLDQGKTKVNSVPLHNSSGSKIKKWHQEIHQTCVNWLGPTWSSSKHWNTRPMVPCKRGSAVQTVVVLRLLMEVLCAACATPKTTKHPHTKLHHRILAEPWQPSLFQKIVIQFG